MVAPLYYVTSTKVVSENPTWSFINNSSWTLLKKCMLLKSLGSTGNWVMTLTLDPYR